MLPAGMVVIVIMMMVIMKVLVLFSAVHHYVYTGAFYAAFDRRLCFHHYAWKTQSVEFFHESGSLIFIEQLKERSSQHIAGSSHAAVYKHRSHFPAPIWFMRLAMKPAPNPLSIFTQATPLAHELSIERRAESPWNDAP